MNEKTNARLTRLEDLMNDFGGGPSESIADRLIAARLNGQQRERGTDDEIRARGRELRRKLAASHRYEEITERRARR